MLRLPVLGGAQIIAFAGLIETTGFFQAASTTDGRGPREGQFSMKDSTETGEPGNYGVGFPTFLGKVEDPEARKSKLAAELANGRLAMMAIIGMFFQVLGFRKLFGTNCYLLNVLLNIFNCFLASLGLLHCKLTFVEFHMFKSFRQIVGELGQEKTCLQLLHM